MIAFSELFNFFNREAEAAKKSWEALMALPVKDRVRKRRAIEGVYLDKDYSERSPDGETLLKLTINKNLSDFKEGDSLLLHEANTNTGLSCTLFSFEGDTVIYISVYSMPSTMENYYDKALLLDKDLVDLRQHVFYKFLFSDSFPKQEELERSLMNAKPTPIFANMDEVETELDETIESFKLEFLPKQREAILNSLAATNYYLIQGPPGTGKSFVLTWIILEEMYFFKHKVIVIGPNHMAINNVVKGIPKAFPLFINRVFKVGQSYNAPKCKVTIGDKEYEMKNYPSLRVHVCNSDEEAWTIGSTPHSLYTNRASGLECDTLIIDEAGQMTIPLALMGMFKAKKVIFAGDHKQLPPIISSDEIQGEMRQSAFQALMTDDNYTMLDVSFRMCEPICNFVSDLFYESKVKSKKEGCGDLIICQEPLYSFDTPVVIHHVEDYGEQVSDKEAEFIAETIAELLKKGLPANEIAVLSPFRAQAANVRRKIRKHPEISEEQAKLVVADTIDKMQGQEREVIIYTLVSGNMDYMTEMADFLYNPNKMNVAFSRAKSKLIIVGNIDQIKKLNSSDFPHLKCMLESKYVTFI